MTPWTQAETDWIVANQSGQYADFVAAGFTSRTPNAFWQRRKVMRRDGLITGYAFDGYHTTTLSEVGGDDAPAPEVRRTLLDRFRSLMGDGRIPSAPLIATSKRTGGFSWDDAQRTVAERQQAQSQASSSQHHARIVVDTEVPFPIICLGDLHIGAFSTDHGLIASITDEILSVPNLRVILLGDLVNMATNVAHGLAALRDDVLGPGEQYDALESWLHRLDGRILAATWGNHDIERQEKALGYSPIARLLARHTIYTNGIGELQLDVGDQPYTLAITHRYRSRSVDNPVLGPMNYIRRENPDVDVAIAGDSHVPGMATFVHGRRHRIAINTGSAQLNSGYAKRYFSLYTAPVFPVLVLDPRRYAPRAFWTLEDYLDWSELAVH
jgi:predicted phosphodiesterase